MSLWLQDLGANVLGLSLPPPSNPNLYEIIKQQVFAEEIDCDLRDLPRLTNAVGRLQPDVVFHLAAQPIVRRSYSEPLETFTTNALGTANLLEAVRRAGRGCIVVVITSDKCYENREWDFAYRENDPLGGHDIYSMSKAAAELVAQAWNKSFFLPNADLGPVATVRAGNVIGGGDYAESRIIPDCVRGLMQKQPLVVRNPQAIRPWQHVLECVSGYLWLAARLEGQPKTSPLATPFNFGPEPSSRQTVRRLVEEFFLTWPGQWTDGSDPNSPHEAKLLSLAIEKAGALLDWRPCWDFPEAVARTASWYHERHVKKNQDMVRFSLEQIAQYAAAAQRKNLPWAKP